MPAQPRDTVRGQSEARAVTPADKRRRRGGGAPDGPRGRSAKDDHADEIDWFAELRSPSPRRSDRPEPDRDGSPGPVDEAGRRPPAPSPGPHPGRPHGGPPPDHRRRPNDRVELLPPGLADADERPPRRRIPVIDGEVTGEFPAFVDGEVTGEMPAVGTPSRRRGRPGAEPPRQRPAPGPPPRGPAPPGPPPGPFPPGPPPPGGQGYGESPFEPPDLEPDKQDKKAKKKARKDRKRRDKGRGPEADLPTEPPHASGPPRPPHGPMPPGPMSGPPVGPMPPEPPGPPGPVLEQPEEPRSTRLKPPPADKSSKRRKSPGAKGQPTPADVPPGDEHGLDKTTGRPRDASLARPRRPRLGGRSQLRAQLRQVQRLRLLTLAFVTLVLLGSLPGFFLIRYATQDPGFRAMDALELPGWAARDPVDQARGSRWCLRECRVRHRMWESERAPQPTVEAYQRALRGGGWKRWEVTRCPPWKVRGDYTCWRRDAYTLDLWIRGPECRGDTEQCPGAVVTVVIRNAGADARLQ